LKNLGNPRDISAIAAAITAKYQPDNSDISATNSDISATNGEAALA
jgi:hypothetical protein